MAADDHSTPHRIKKYPNRRLYDSTGRRHVTLGELHDLVRSGHEIVVTDSKSGSDITNVVLAQIILEHDPPKLDLLPSSLLHLAIQTAGHDVRRFVDQYLVQAMAAFAHSRRQFERFAQQPGMSFPQTPNPMDWTRMMFGGSPPSDPPPPPEPPPEPPRAPSPVADPDPVEALRDELDALRVELTEMKNDRRGPAKRGKGVPKGTTRKKTRRSR